MINDKLFTDKRQIINVINEKSVKQLGFSMSNTLKKKHIKVIN